MPLVVWGSMVAAWRCGCRVGNVLGGRKDVHYGIGQAENEHVDGSLHLHKGGCDGFGHVLHIRAGNPWAPLVLRYHCIQCTTT